MTQATGVYLSLWWRVRTRVQWWQTKDHNRDKYRTRTNDYRTRNHARYARAASKHSEMLCLKSTWRAMPWSRQFEFILKAEGGKLRNQLRHVWSLTKDQCFAVYRCFKCQDRTDIPTNFRSHVSTPSHYDILWSSSFKHGMEMWSKIW